MEENLSSPQAYSITESANGRDFYFVTDQGIEYIAYFTEADGYVSSASFAEKAKVFGFAPTQQTRPVGKLPKDDKVGNTLFDILYYYIAQRPDIVLFYVCSDESVWRPGPDHRDLRFAKQRSRTFSIWFEQWQRSGVLPAEKIDFRLYGQICCSCLWRRGNPDETEIRAVVTDTVLLKQPVP